MTENQQRIIDSLVAEFNKQNETKDKRPFKLIDVDEFDAINQRHAELTADAKRTKDVWEGERHRYIDELITQIREDVGDRLCVTRGCDIEGNQNLANYIYIHKHSTPRHSLWEYALRIEVVLLFKNIKDDITKEYYTHYIGFELRRYVSPNTEKKYKDEVELFNCKNTKYKLKELLS